MFDLSDYSPTATTCAKQPRATTAQYTDLSLHFAQQNTPAYSQAAAALIRIACNVKDGAHVALAGGWLRDQFWGFTPKDMDFAFTGMSVDGLKKVLQMYIERSPYRIEHSDFDDYDGADKDLMYVVKVTEHWPDGPREMDWILYRVATTREAVELFDHGINGFYAEFDGFEFSIGHWGEWGACTRNPNVGCSPERVERMREIARIVDWTYVDVQ